MSQHFKLTHREFYFNVDVFNILEIEADQVINRNYQEIVSILKKQHKKLAFISHPDKGGDKNRFGQVYSAYQKLKEYVEPLKSGSPCCGSGNLTAREFLYRKKLFSALQIGKEEVIGADFKELSSILQQRLSNGFASNDVKQLYFYISPLKRREDLVDHDKRLLASKFIEHKDALLLLSEISFLPLALLTTFTILCYFSCLIIAFNFVVGIMCNSLMSFCKKKYKNSEISIDDLLSKSIKILVSYPLAAFSIYLVAASFMSNGFTISEAILGSLLLLAVLVEILASIFSRGCKVYAERYITSLLEGDLRNRTQRETDILKWYDLRRLFVPIVMPLVEKSFAGVTSEFCERSFDEDIEKTANISDISLEVLSKPKEVDFMPQSNSMA